MSERNDEDVVADAIEILYSGPPDQFMDQRSDLSKAARAKGEAEAAKAITALRRPTAAAAAVNRHVRHQGNSVDRLLDMGARLREAHDALDAGRLRELSAERRALVSELARSALETFGPDSPSSALRDDVSDTFDAAVADPEIAGRLGELVRPEHWSGFGVASGSGPELTLVHGGRNTVKSPGKQAPAASRTKADERPEPKEPKPPSAARRRSDRMLTRARDAFDSAESELLAAQQDEQTDAHRVRALGAELAELSRQVESAKRQLEDSRRALNSARTRRREARSALDRAERNAPND